MSDLFLLYIDRLKDGKEELIEEKVSSDFMHVEEEDLRYEGSVEVKGKAYLVDNEVIMNLTLHAKAKIPCSICNEKVDVPIDIYDVYHTIETQEIPSSVYHYGDFIREMILIETPRFTECHQGNCPERKNMGSFLHDPAKKDDVTKEGYQPFADWPFEER